jgi:hypothetical protein
MAETNQIQDAQSVTWALQCQATNTAGIVDESTRIRLTLLATVDTNPVLDYTTSSNSMVAAISELNAIGSTCGGAIGIVAQVLDSMAGMADQDSSVISTINVSSVDTAVIISVETSNALRYTSVIEGMAAQDIATSLSILTAQRSETNATQDEYNYLSGPQSIDVFISEISHIFDTISATGVGLVVKPENIGRLDFAVAEKRKIFVKTEVVHVVTKVIKPLFYRR